MMAAKRTEIDWDNFNTLEKIAGLRLSRGERNALTPSQVELINQSLQIALQGAGGYAFASTRR